jgi:hypothetical protein
VEDLPVMVVLLLMLDIIECLKNELEPPLLFSELLLLFENIFELYESLLLKLLLFSAVIR